MMCCMRVAVAVKGLNRSLVIMKTGPCSIQRILFNNKKMKISLEKMIFSIFVLKTLIVGTR